MPNPQVFLPNSSTKPQSSLFKKIFSYAFVALMIFISVMRTVSTNGGFIILGATAIMFAVVALFVRRPVSITVSVEEHTLQYIYKNIIGSEKTITVDLSNAVGTYKYELFSKVSSGWRLLLYNGNYFNNRVSIEQRAGGFSKEQLDEIVALIHQCQNLPV